MILVYNKSGKRVEQGDKVMLNDGLYEVVSFGQSAIPSSEGFVIMSKVNTTACIQYPPSLIEAKWIDEPVLVDYELKVIVSVPYTDPLHAEEFLEDVLRTEKLHPRYLVVNKLTKETRKSCDITASGWCVGEDWDCSKCDGTRTPTRPSEGLILKPNPVSGVGATKFIKVKPQPEREHDERGWQPK